MGVFLWAETLTVGFFLLMLSSALLGPLGNPDQGQEAPGWLRLVWLPVYAVMLGLLLWTTPRLMSVWLGALVVMPVVLWSLMSTYWSIDPGMTQRRSIALILPTLFALYLAARYDWRTLIRFFAWTSVILAVGSAFVALAVPSLGVDQVIHVGAWKGLFFEKNGAGGFMARGTLACLAAMSISPRHWWFWLGSALFCSFMVVMSTSTTALLMLLIVWCGAIAILFMRLGPAFAVSGLWLMAAGAAVIGIALALFPDLFFGLVGKDATLTGRTKIWQAILRQSALQPWEGYGYGAFWKLRPEGPSAWVQLQANWKVLAADNAWLDMLVQIGRIGIGLFVLTVVFFIPPAVRSIFGKGPEGYWAPLLIITLLLTSITESVLLKQNDLTWVIYVATLAKLLQAREPEPHRWT